MALLQLFSLIYYHPGGLYRLCSPDAHVLFVPLVYRGAAAAQSLSYCSAIWSERFCLKTWEYHSMPLFQVVEKQLASFKA